MEQNLQLVKLESVDFKFNNSIFQNISQKYSNKLFLALDTRIFILLGILHNEKFKGTFSKMTINSNVKMPKDNIFFKK